MKSISDLRYEKGELINKMKRLLDTADDEGRGVTEAEDKAYTEMDKRCDEIDRQIAGLEGFDARRQKLAEANKVVNPFNKNWLGSGGSGTTRSADTGGFSGWGEYLHAVKCARVDNIRDERLEKLNAEKRDMVMQIGSSGGFAVPDAYSSMFLAVPSQAGIVRKYCQQLPVGDPADAPLHIPALDQTTATGGVYGGLQISHGAEGLTLTETNAKLRQITLEPKQLNCYLPVSNKLLMNWPTANPTITKLMGDGVEGQIDTDCLTGNGINRALGVINAPATLTVSRVTASEISYIDVVTMFSKLLPRGGNPVWVANPTTIPSLATIKDGANHYLWVGGANVAQGAAAAPVPNSLFGLPIHFSERVPTLGNRGDIGLYDFSYYLMKPGSGPRVDISTEFLFTKDMSVFRIIMMLDAKPWLSEPWTMEGSSESLSPFVVLV